MHQKVGKHRRLVLAINAAAIELQHRLAVAYRDHSLSQSLAWNSPIDERPRARMPHQPSPANCSRPSTAVRRSMNVNRPALSPPDRVIRPPPRRATTRRGAPGHRRPRTVHGHRLCIEFERLIALKRDAPSALDCESPSPPRPNEARVRSATFVSVAPDHLPAQITKNLAAMAGSRSVHRTATTASTSRRRCLGTSRRRRGNRVRVAGTLAPQPHLRRGCARCARPCWAIDHDLVGGHRPPTKRPNTRPTQPGPVYDTEHGHNHRTLSKHPDGVQCRSTIWVRCMVACRAQCIGRCIGPQPVTAAPNALAPPTLGARFSQAVPTYPGAGDRGFAMANVVQVDAAGLHAHAAVCDTAAAALSGAAAPAAAGHLTQPSAAAVAHGNALVQAAVGKLAGRATSTGETLRTAAVNYTTTDGDSGQSIAAVQV